VKSEVVFANSELVVNVTCRRQKERATDALNFSRLDTACMVSTDDQSELV